MENLDLDINNYSINDIEKFFKLKKKTVYTVDDIELKETQIREQLLKTSSNSKVCQFLKSYSIYSVIKGKYEFSVLFILFKVKLVRLSLI